MIQYNPPTNPNYSLGSRILQNTILEPSIFADN